MAAWTSLQPSAAIAAFAERVIEGRRVLLFGSAKHNLWTKALERGARLVHVCDPDLVRLSEAAARNTSALVSFAPLSNQASLALRDGAFDLGIVDNIAALGDIELILRQLRRALSPRGLAFITAPNPDVSEPLLPDLAVPVHALNYYTLYDVVRTEFPIVRMLGQMPFVGYTIAELAPLDNPEPTLDAGFVPGGTEEPEWFVAAASAHPFEIDTFTVVQIPVLEVLHDSSERQLREQLLASLSAERSAVERLARLEAQHSQLAARAAESRNESELEAQLERLKEELNRKEHWISSLEARAATADQRSDDAEHQLELMQQQLDQANRAEARHTQLEQELRDASQRATNADRIAAEAAADVAKLEMQLRDRGARIRELQAELRAVELVGQQLLRELETARDSQSQQFGTQPWSTSAQIAAPPESLGTDVSQSPEETSAWASRMASDEAAPVGLSIRVAESQSAADDRARLQADIHAASWRIDQLLTTIERYKDAERPETPSNSRPSGNGFISEPA